MVGSAADERDLRLEPDVLEQRRHPPSREMASPPIPDELLLEIFRRIPDPADLVRTTAACVSFRRLIADRSFLRRYRKLHAPPLLGFFERVFYPATAPHPSASAANAVALVADFSFSFLPAPTSDWIVRDIRDGRVLLDRAPQHDIANRYRVVFPELVVCDPLYRRYILLPPIPDDLTATVEYPVCINKHRYCGTFLAPSHHDDETSFSVIWMGQCRTKLLAFVFSSSTGQWQAIPSKSWSDLFDGLLSSTGMALFACRQYAYGCFYWECDLRDRLLVLDTRRMEFSIAEKPPEARSSDLPNVDTGLILPGPATAIVEAGEGRLGMFVHPHFKNYLNYSIRQNTCGGSSHWQFEKTIPLDSGYLFMGSAGRHLFLYRLGGQSLDAGFFTLDVKTFQIERVLVSGSCMPIAHAYSNFPPSLLSTPTVPASGVENGVEKEMLEQGFAASSSADASAGGQAED